MPAWKNPKALRKLLQNDHLFRFRFVLAGHLKMSLSEVDDMDAKEFGEWLAFHEFYPIDGTREDVRHAIQCQVIQSQWDKPEDAETFIPRFGEQVVNEQAMMDRFKTAFNGLLVKRKNG